MTTIYLIRHTAYEYAGDLVPFRTPGVHLSGAGREHAERLKNFFSNKNITVVYASPLERAKETATIIADGKRVTADSRLNEADCPPMSHAQSGWSKYVASWYHGESKKEIVARMEDFINEKVRAHAGQEIIVVSHGDPITLYLAKYYNKPVEALPYIHMGIVTALAFAS